MWITVRPAAASLALCFVLGTAACASPEASQLGREVTATTASASGSCTWQRESGNPNAKYVGTPPPTGGDQLGVHTMTITTNLGVIMVRLVPADAPCTVASFAYLAGRKFFDGTRCHRLVTSGIYVLQCGDPSGTGAGGPGYMYPDENLSGTTGSYPAGTVAMANAGPNTNGSQFFIVYQDSPLPPQYTPFGTVTGGLDLVRTVADGGTDNGGDGHPKVPVAIQSLTVN